MKIGELNLDKSFSNFNMSIDTEGDFDMEIEDEKDKEIEDLNSGIDHELRENSLNLSFASINEESRVEDDLYIGGTSLDSEFDMMEDDLLELEAEDAEDAEFEFYDEEDGEIIDSTM